jgi:SNF2 family DNA or RNA helicase
MQVIDNTAIRAMLPARVADMTLGVVEKSRLVESHGDWKDILLYWGQSEAMTLAAFLDAAGPKLDVPRVPSPMLRDYTWPGIHKPFEHQRDTASFLSLRQRAFCFNEAGTGKTSAAIWAADYLMEIGLIKRALIICPLSIMYSAWQDDIFKTAMHRKCGIAHGSVSKRIKVINNDYDFVVINFDGVSTVANELHGKFDLIIVDEANAYKSATTKRWKTLAKLLQPSTRLWMMTGTPAAQSPVDAFGLAKLVSPQRVPKFTGAWRDRVMYQASRFRWLPRLRAQEVVHEALQPAIRYTKKDCLDLPPVVYQTRDVALTPQVQALYKHLKSQLLIETAGEQISAVNAASALNKLLQISGGAVYTDGGQTLELDVSPRLNALKEALDETLNKVVVFVSYLHTIGVVTKFLNSEHISCEVIQGSVPARERSQIIDRFQTQESPRVLVVQPQSAAHGITLTAADTVVFWSPVMSVETYLQCIARIDRVGQKNNMTVVHLQGSEVERKMYRMLQGKVDNHQKLVDLYKQELDEVYE